MQLYRARDEIEAQGARLALIGQLTPRHAAHFRRRVSVDLTVLADEQRVSYRAAGAKVATMRELLGPQVVAKGAAATRRYGVIQGRTLGHPAQLGGAMLILPDGRVAWSHMSQDASDNASAQDIIEAIAAPR